jgi:uncharacterized protein with von Willebrand factor type A (vWA) domain
LREAGLEVGPGRIADALIGLDLVDLTSRDDVYWTLRQTLVRDGGSQAFDAAFRAWFLRAGSGVPPRHRGAVLRLLRKAERATTEATQKADDAAGPRAAAARGFAI